MPLNHPTWLADDERRHQIDPSAAQRGEAFFGFERLQVREKTERVLKHFNSVAAVYDFMNTLLSLGIHHAWKRAGVRLLDLRPGERVLDVCGGTGDLAGGSGLPAASSSTTSTAP
jgi:demethylmenaquinone methyltransferase / 2-methoxy-6-polyprenyl-1,4-benzoquinol methylase